MCEIRLIHRVATGSFHITSIVILCISVALCEFKKEGERLQKLFEIVSSDEEPTEDGTSDLEFDQDFDIIFQLTQNIRLV